MSTDKNQPTKNYTTRRIYKTAHTAENAIKELVTIILMCELSDPGSEVFFVSPWISNVPLLDNTSGTFDSLNPDWGHMKIRLSDVTTQLTTLGSKVNIVTRTDEHNKYFLTELRNKVNAQGSSKLLKIVKTDLLHTKGILTGHGVLTGSMNLTYNGFTNLDEQVTYDTATEDIAQSKLAFMKYIRDQNDE